MVVNGSLSKTAVNGGAGARSQLSGLTVAVLTVVTLLFLTGLFEQLPEATLAAVVIAAVIELVDIPALRRLYRVWTRRLGAVYGKAARADFIGAVAAMLGVLLFDTLPGLFIGIAVSILLLLYRACEPHIARLTGAQPSVWVDVERHPTWTPTRACWSSGWSRPCTSSTPTTSAARSGRWPCRRSQLVVLDAQTTPAIDVTATEMLATLARDLHHQGITFAVAHDIGQTRDVLLTAGGDEHLLSGYATVDDAVAALLT